MHLGWLVQQTVSKHKAYRSLIASLGSLLVKYRIVGNFRMVQTFMVFADRSAAAKIRTMKISMFARIILS